MKSELKKVEKQKKKRRKKYKMNRVRLVQVRYEGTCTGTSRHRVRQKIKKSRKMNTSVW